FLFARGHPNSVWVIIDALEEFKNVSGLVPSIPKSTTFFCNVLNALKASILCSMSFAKGTLPVKYLGVPLISSRLLYYDCKVLVEKLEKQLMRGFLWCQRDMKKGKAKVAWEAVCLPHYEGGLGIRRLDDFNVLINKESLWVQWIHSYKLKGKSFWDVPCLGDVSWGWRKLLQIRSCIRPFIWHKINNGRSTSMWFDRWADSCPLRDMLMVRNIVCSRFSLSNTVSDLISNGSWRWPHDWSARFPNVVNIPVSYITNDLDDVIVWCDVHGVFHRFSVAGACDSLRLRADVVNWYHVFWFPHCIPRHALHIWLVIKKKLKTQDRLRQWDVRAFTGMSSVPPQFVDILAFLIPYKGSLVSNVISQIVLAATTYCLLNERNSRLFKKKKSTTD
ncbi:putative gag-pol polyprotein, partial [Tanacetum coccineum]